MSAWEYRIVTQPNDRQLNDLGTQGWELIAVSLQDTYASRAVAYFKRPLPKELAR